MEHNRKTKIISILALVIAIVGMSLGFAAFSTSLNISSSASVTPNSGDFSVKFSTSQSSLVEGDVVPSSKTANLVTTNGVIVNGSIPMMSNLSATFTQPGDYVEYTVYVRNEGAYMVYLNNINFIGEKTCVGVYGTTDALVQSACPSINVTATINGVTYNETTSISSHALAVNSFEPLKIKLEYDSLGNSVDGPFSVTFPSVSLLYSTVDNSSMKPDITRVVSGDIETIGSEVAIGNEHFYVYGSEGESVKLLSKYNLYVGGRYDSTKNQYTPYGSEATGIQNSLMIGFVEGSSIHEGAVEYTGELTNYVDNYGAYITGLGVNIEEARLFRLEEIGDLGCDINYSDCSYIPKFTYATSYWTDDTLGLDYYYAIRSNGFLMTDYYTFQLDSVGYGVRPVIIMSKEEFNV